MSDEFDSAIAQFAVFVLVQIFIPCHLINELENLTGNFCFNIYESNWIGADRHRLQDLRILMETTKKPIVLKVAHLFTLNLKTFLDVSLQSSQIGLINFKFDYRSSIGLTLSFHSSFISRNKRRGTSFNYSEITFRCLQNIDFMFTSTEI